MDEALKILFGGLEVDPFIQTMLRHLARKESLQTVSRNLGDEPCARQVAKGKPPNWDCHEFFGVGMGRNWRAGDTRLT
jgi:hypothetical protein